MEQVFFRYRNQDWLFEKVDLHLSRGEKVALVGANGSGKTTLTRLITGELKPQEGRIQLGPRTQIGYYAQLPTITLNPESSIYEEVVSSTPADRLPYIREVLGIFQFSGDEIYKKIGVLSGGEKARISLAKILLSPANFLIMDEPTTHLDLIAREALEEALRGYEGTLLIISHDRYFLDKIVHKVIEIKNKQLITYPGNYSYYSVKRNIVHQQLLLPEGQKNTRWSTTSIPFLTPGKTDDSLFGLKKLSPPGRKTKEQRRQEAEARQAISQKRRTLRLKIEDTERKIISLETRKKELEEILAQPQTYQKKGEEIARLQKEYSELRHQLDHFYQVWEKLTQDLENLLAGLPSAEKK
jgi:ATP-binding cassette subfamily F protein 3